MGAAEALRDKRAIPSLARATRDKFLPMLGEATFSCFADAFEGTKGVAHRKSIVYVVHELFIRHSTVIGGAHKISCLQNFLVRIGQVVRVLPEAERAVYLRLPGEWLKKSVLDAAQVST